MTQEELFLFKELLKETVKSAVKEVVREELENSFKKDLKEVKQLVAKSIKEAREASAASYQQQSSQNPEELRARLREAVGSDFGKKPTVPFNSQPQIPRMSEEAAMNMSMNGSLPNIDAPIPFINKGSLAWKEMKQKIS